jgi:hypothetical protein
VNAVMITMELRTEGARNTAARLAEVGVVTEVFVQPHEWPIGPESNRANSLFALKWARDNLSAPGFLFVEDDIIIQPNRFLRACSDSVMLNELVYFYMHDFAPRTNHYPNEEWIQDMVSADQYSRPERFDRDSFRVPEGLRRMKDDAAMYGSQCVYIPMRYVDEIIEFMTGNIVYSRSIRSRPTHPFDHVLNVWKNSSNRPVFCYLPHPVQHLQDRTGRSPARAGVYSLSFDLISDKDEVHDE